MRFNPTIDAIIQSGKLFGDQRYNGKVTIDPEWSMAETAPVYGTAYRGPYRYWQDATNPRDEWVLPNVVSIEIDRSLSQDIATCTIRMLNQWHTDNLEEPELVNQLGQPGYFWPDRGVSEDSGTLWNHTPSEGAYRRDGTWDAGFSWTNAIVPDVILRTWEGYGGHDLSVDEAIEAGNIQITGVWLVDTISAGTDGMLELTCRDVGRLLLDQIVYPPVIPPALYPLEYYPPGKSAFDSIWSPAAHSGVSPASFGEVPAIYSSSYTDEVFGQANYAIGGTHRGSHMLDGNVKTFAWSPAEAQATSATTKAWWEVTFHRPEALDLVSLQPWAGGYTAFICVFAGGEWKGSALVPGESIRYVKQVQIPLAIPNGLEHEMRIEFDRIEAATRVRVYLLNNWYYSGIPDNEGNMYRCGIRTFRAIRKNDIAKQFSPEWNELPWTFALDQHPTRGYWVAESTGWIHGFGDAADYDSNSFGTVDVLYWSEYNKVVGIAAHPSGMGYWVLDRLGHIYAHGEAAHMGEVALPWVEGMHGWNEVQAIDIAATHTGNGYWVLYTNGVVYGFGDAWPTYWEVPPTNLSIRMMSTDYRLPYLKPADNEFGFTLEYSYRYWDASRKGMAIAAHPHAMGFWVTDGAGQVFNAGAAQYFGQFHERVYNDGASNSFRLERDEFPTAIEVTETGNGYWICNGSGRIASFGDANPKGITYVYPGETPKIDWVPRTLQSPMTYDYGSMDWSFFRALVWGLARDPDGSGFWVLTADGNVRAYDAEWWGQPGYFGLTGFRWHQGNYSDRSDIVKDLLAWGGWTWTADGAGILASGEELQPGESLYSANFYHLKMQTDGNLVLRDPQGHVVWHTGTFTHPGAFARMQTDGNLVIYDGEDDIFDTGTYSYPGAYLRVQTDGNLSIVDTGGTARWNSETWVKEQNNLRPLVYGNIESTGINAEIDIRGDIFDKKTLLDAITQIKESVGYNFYIDYAGAANFKSPNWWRAGNFDDETGGRLYTKVVGDEVVRTTEDDEDGAPHIPVVHEAVDMFNYSVTLSSVAQRSEIIIGSDTPDPRDPTKTGFVRYTPPDAVAEIRPGVPALRNVHKPAMWINTHFEQPEEQQLMAELIALQIWFARRTGSVTCIANPNIDIDDQVRLIERNTSETYIHYVRGKKTSGDLQSGMYSMTLTTNWLGNEDDWVITSSNTYTPLRQFQISELVDKWQLNTSRGVAFSGLGKGFVTFEGGFDAIS